MTIPETTVATFTTMPPPPIPSRPPQTGRGNKFLKQILNPQNTPLAVPTDSTEDFISEPFLEPPEVNSRKKQKE